MNPVTGRCAILFPHGVLTRDEEDGMREKLVRADLIECIIGIGKNLFYNCPMEACVIVCRMKKSPERKGKILFIDAKHEVTRKNSFSFLEDKHINKIVSAYQGFADVDDFAHVADLNEIEGNKFKLGISKYVRHGGPDDDNIDLDDAIGEWMIVSDRLKGEVNALDSLLEVAQ